MVRRVFGRGSRWLVYGSGLMLVAVVLTACGGHRTVLTAQTVTAATRIAPTASPTPYATAPGGNTTPDASVVGTTASAAGTAVSTITPGASAVASAPATVAASAMAGTPSTSGSAAASARVGSPNAQSLQGNPTPSAGTGGAVTSTPGR